LILRNKHVRSVVSNWKLCYLMLIFFIFGNILAEEQILGRFCKRRSQGKRGVFFQNELQTILEHVKNFCCKSTVL